MFTSRMFDMWSSVTSKLEAQTQIQTNIQQTTLQNSSSGSIKGKDEGLLRLSIFRLWFYREDFFLKCSKPYEWALKASSTLKTTRKDFQTALNRIKKG